jgi:hypothetical protein
MDESFDETAETSEEPKVDETDAPTGRELADENPADTPPLIAETSQVVSTEPGVKAPAPPGFKPGDNWNSDDARRAYEAAGTSLEEEQRKDAIG